MLHFRLPGVLERGLLIFCIIILVGAELACEGERVVRHSCPAPLAALLLSRLQGVLEQGVFILHRLGTERAHFRERVLRHIFCTFEPVFFVPATAASAPNARCRNEQRPRRSEPLNRGRRRRAHCPFTPDLENGTTSARRRTGGCFPSSCPPRRFRHERMHGTV